MNCKICNAKSEFFLNADIFDEHFLIDYYKCEFCGFIQTTEPTWLEKAYSEAIAPLDIGLLHRNRMYSDLTERLILTFFAKATSFVDFGAGYGVFVRMMRDKGFDFKWFDKHCENIFAKQFEVGSIPNKTDIITAFEVFEHLPNPKEQLSEIISNSSVLIFSTDITALQQENFKDWWYRAPHSGQHVSFFSTESLKLLAKEFDRYFYSNGRDFHFFSDILLREDEVNEFFNPKRSTLIKRVFNKFFPVKKALQPRESLLMKDHAYLTNLYVKKNSHV